MSRSQTQLVTIHSALSDHETQVSIFPTDNNPSESLDRIRSFPPDHQQSLLDFNPLNGQNFDQVLHKLKQGMKAARGGGWVDINSDSGDELETPTTAPDQDPDVENEEDLTDSSSLSLRLLHQPQPQPTSLNGSSPHNSNPLYSPLVVHSNSPPQKKDSSKTTPLGPLHFSSALNTPTSPFGPITPPPNIGSYPKPPSPYVRHHFKWEFNPASLQPGLSPNNSQQQPRLIETGPTSTRDSNWGHQQQHQPLEALLINHHPHHQLDFSSMPSATAKASLSDSTRFPSSVHRQNTSPAYVRWDRPSEMLAPNSHDRPSEIPRARQHQADQEAKFENLNSCFGSLPTGRGITTDSQPESAINPSLISSVPFSLAPTAATVRLTAPSKSSTYDNQQSVNKPVSRDERDRDSFRVSLLKPPSNGAKGAFLSSPKNQLFQAPLPSAPTTATPRASAPPCAQPFASQNPPLSSPAPSSLSGLFQNMRLSSFPTSCAPPSLYTTPAPTPLLGFVGAPAFPPLNHYSHQKQPPKTTVPGFGVGVLTPSVTTPLPGQVQPEEARKSVKTQPPVVNTGNSGAMVPQPGDWMCMCGFVNWRRRKVCMRCFPFADGNDSVGAMMAMNAQRAALLAAGGSLPDHNPHQSLPTNPAVRTPAIDTSALHNFQQQSSLRQIFGGQPKSAGTERPRARNPFDNSYPTVPENELDVSKYKEWDDDDELEINTRTTVAARRRSCSLGNYSGVWDSSAPATTAAGGGSDESSGGVVSYPGSGIVKNNGLSESLNCLTVPFTNSNSNYRNRQRMDTATTSPGSSWQAIRALWQ